MEVLSWQASTELAAWVLNGLCFIVQRRRWGAGIESLSFLSEHHVSLIVPYWDGAGSLCSPHLRSEWVVVLSGRNVLDIIEILHLKIMCLAHHSGVCICVCVLQNLFWKSLT